MPSGHWPKPMKSIWATPILTTALGPKVVNALPSGQISRPPPPPAGWAATGTAGETSADVETSSMAHSPETMALTRRPRRPCPHPLRLAHKALFDVCPDTSDLISAPLRATAGPHYVGLGGFHMVRTR